MVYNGYIEAPFEKEERGTFPLPHPMAPPISHTNNDEHLIVSTYNDSIMFRNDCVMEIAQPDINKPIYLPNLLFIE